MNAGGLPILYMNKSAKKVTPIKASPKQTVASALTGPFHFHGLKFHFGFIAAVVVFCFTIYGNGISNGFSLDDEFVIHGDTTVEKGISSVPKLFKMRYAWDQKGSYGYRPLVKASFAIETQVFGGSPHAGHVINILMYAFLCVFLFYFLRKIFYEKVSDYFLLLFIAIFISHPIHTEVVDSLKNRDVLMVTIFGLYCTFAFVKAFETNNIVSRILWIISGIISFDLGDLCKPDVLIYIAITPLVLVFFSKLKYKAAAVSVITIFAGRMLLNRALHHILPHTHYHRTFIFIEDPLLHTHWYQRIALGFYSLWFYLRKLIFPKDMVCYYGYSTINPYPAWTDGSVLIGIIITCIMCYVCYKNRKEMGLLMFSLLLFAGTTFAYVNIIAVGPGIVADRFDFIPSIGFILLVMLLGYHLLKLPLKNKLYGLKAQYLYIAAGALVLIYSGRTIARNPDWASHLSVYAHDAKIAPHSSKLQSLLAAAYIQKIQENPGMSADEKALDYQLSDAAYRASVDVFPGYTTSLNNLGMIQYNYYKNLNGAIAYFDKALSFDSNYAEAYFNKGAAEETMGKKDEAEQCYLKAIKVKPEYYITYAYLSKLYFSEGNLGKVLQVNQDALDKGYSSDVLYVNIGNVFLARKDTAKAIGCYERALACFSRNISLAEFIVKYYTGKNDLAKVEYYNQLIENTKEQSTRRRKEE